MSEIFSDHVSTLQEMILGEKSLANAKVVHFTSPLGAELLSEARAYQTGSQTPVAILKNDKCITLVFQATPTTSESGSIFSVHINEDSSRSALETPSLVPDHESSHSTYFTAREERFPSNEILEETHLPPSKDLSDEITFLIPWSKDNDPVSDNVCKEEVKNGNFPSCSTPAYEGVVYEAELPSIQCSPIKKRPFEAESSNSVIESSAKTTKSFDFSNPLTKSTFKSSTVNGNGENSNRTRKGSTESGFSQPSSFSSTRSRKNYSKAEEDALVNGLRKYGKRFRKIWFAYSSVFHPKRTPVSLYDKYRHDKKIKLKAGKAEEL